jgi:hypothetical protein
VIEQVTSALVGHIHTSSADLGEWVVVHSLSAADPDPAAGKLVACLLAVDELEHFRNSPAGQRLNVPQGSPLRLHYLFTYFGPHDEAMTRIARLLEIFDATPVLGPGQLPSPLAGQVERVTVQLHNTTTAERHQVWGALGRPGRLGLFYDVDVQPLVKSPVP